MSSISALRGINPGDVPEERTRAGVTWGGVRGLLPPLPQGYDGRRDDVNARVSCKRWGRTHGFADGGGECRWLKSEQTTRETRKHKRTRGEDETKMGHGCPKTHTNRKERNWAAVAYFSAKQGLDILYAESESVTIQCTPRNAERERDGGRESRSRRKGESCRRQNARRRRRKESLVFRLKAADECSIEARLST